MHGLQHEDAFYPPTGGVNVTDGELSSLREVLVVALESISSSSDADQRKRAQFDVVMARTLHNQVPIDPGEASRPEVWSFLTCVLLPDVARWRFPDTTDPARFVGGVRNTFQRLWWRAHLLATPQSEEPYRVLEQLLEDQLVSIMERPNVRANAVLARAIANSMVDLRQRLPQGQVEAVSRDRVKRIRQLFPIVSFEALDESETIDLVSGVFRH